MLDILFQILVLIGIDILVLGLFVLMLLPLSKYRPATFAILKRNFVGYFNNPTGYAFLCVFVLLASFAAFWPHEFFNSNMATLHQLNRYFPFVMLVFIPAITMSIWAEERREGTDELLLTIPAGDFDIVLGKYLAAASIFTASLVFAQMANFSVLDGLALGQVDMGLFFVTYLGYWMMGLAMLSIGMVASFLTRNLTIGFILGALLNAPLAFAVHADVVIPWTNASQAIGRWSFSSQFEDFGRGVVSLSSTTYFVALIALGIYLSVVLLGRRHWLGGRDGHSKLGHYLVRGLSLLVLAIASSVLFTNHDLIRADLSSEKISSLSKATQQRIDELRLDRPVRIEAFISGTLPEAYVRTKFDLVSMLREFKAMQGDKIVVNINDKMEPLSDEAKQARERYGIAPRVVSTQSRGTNSDIPIFLSAVFTCGPENVVVPFFGLGSSVEYDLTHSITTVVEAAAEQTVDSRKDDPNKKDDSPNRRRKTIGVLRTRAEVTGIGQGSRRSFFLGIPQARPQQFIQTLSKHYSIVNIDPSSQDQTPLPEYDILLAVQPSTLPQMEINYLVETIRSGKPTAIFEDPTPTNYGIQVFVPGQQSMVEKISGTGERYYPTFYDRLKRQEGIPPSRWSLSGDLDPLWDLLGVKILTAQFGMVESLAAPNQPQPTKRLHWRMYYPTIFQRYNPYPKIGFLEGPIVFANANVNTSGLRKTFRADQPAVAGFHEVLFESPGAIREKSKAEKSVDARKLEVVPLVTLGGETGVFSPAVPGADNIYVMELNDEREKGLKIIAAMQAADAKAIPPWPVWNDQLQKQLEIARADSRTHTLRTYKPYNLAVRVHSKLSKKSKGKKVSAGQSPEIDVVLVSDVDVLASVFMTLRDQPGIGTEFRFQNRAFIMNLIDALAGEERFLEIRSRQTNHAPLKLIEDRVREASEKLYDTYKEVQEGFTARVQKEGAKRQAVIDQINKDIEDLKKKKDLDPQSLIDAQRDAEDRRARLISRNKEEMAEIQGEFNRQMENKKQDNRRKLNEDRQEIQSRYKIWAVVLPPFPPLLIGLIVLYRRRQREREGVPLSRMRR